MRLSVVSAPASEPISLAEVKAHCRIYGSEDDGLIAGYLMAARVYTESVTGRRLVTQTLDYFIDNLSADEILLPVAPVQSVTSITYIDDSGATQTLSVGAYTTVGRRYWTAIVPTVNASWPGVRNQAESVTVRFVAGHTSTNPVPEPIRQAILMLAGHLYENRETVVVGQAPEVLPMAYDFLLTDYRAHFLT